MDPILFQINQKPKSKGKPGLPKTPTDIAIVTKNGLEGDFNNFRNTKKENEVHFGCPWIHMTAKVAQHTVNTRTVWS